MPRTSGFSGITGVTVPLAESATGMVPPLPQPVYPNVILYAGDPRDGGQAILGSDVSGISTALSRLAFEFVRYGIGGANTVRIAILDQRWMRVEQALFAGARQLFFEYFFADSYSYEKHRWSGLNTGFLARWGPSMTRAGNSVAFDGYGSLAANLTQDVRYWGGGENKISDIVEQIAKGLNQAGDPYYPPGPNAPKAIVYKTVDENGNSTIEPTRSLEETANMNVFTLPQQKVFAQAGRTQLEMLKYLATYAVTAKDPGQRGYKVYTRSDKNGNETLYFTPDALQDAKIQGRNVDWIFSFLYGSPTDEVLEFSANVSADFFAGGPALESSKMQDNPVSKDSNQSVTNTDNSGSSVKNPQNTESKGLSGSVAAPTGGASTGSLSPESESHIAVAHALGFEKWYRGIMQGVQAELVVTGNPAIEVNHIIRLLILYPSEEANSKTQLFNIGDFSTRNVHPLSGHWIVRKATDRIEGGNFTTSLEIQRWEFGDIPTPDLGGELSGLETGNFRTPTDSAEQTIIRNREPPPVIDVEAGEEDPGEEESLDQDGVKKDSPLPCGSLTSEVGMRDINHNGILKEHKGIDIASKAGTPVSCPIDGTLRYAQYGSADPGAGYYVEVTGNDGNTWRFLHLQEGSIPPSFFDKKGNTKGIPIKAGDQLGNVGSTGRSTGPHLHLEVRKGGPKGPALDPLDHVNLPTKACT